MTSGKMRDNNMDIKNIFAGNVGIGTESPTAQLHLTSSLRVSSFGAGNVMTDSDGNFYIAINSFDPCIACAVHVMDPNGEELMKVKVT